MVAKSIKISKKLSRTLEQLCFLFAIIGGFIILGLLGLTIFGVAGRSLGFPIPGDFELIELGMVTAVFMFLPICHFRNCNLFIDAFTSRFRQHNTKILDAAGAFLLALFGALLTWRMPLGGFDFFRFNDQTMVLGIPRFLVFFPITLSAALLTVVSVYTGLRHLEVFRNE